MTAKRITAYALMLTLAASAAAACKALDPPAREIRPTPTVTVILRVSPSP